MDRTDRTTSSGSTPPAPLPRRDPGAQYPDSSTWTRPPAPTQAPSRPTDAYGAPSLGGIDRLTRDLAADILRQAATHTPAQLTAPAAAVLATATHDFPLHADHAFNTDH